MSPGLASPAGKVARADEWDGLENRCGRKATVGSNPTPSATKAQLSWSFWMAERQRAGTGSEGKPRSVPRPVPLSAGREGASWALAVTLMTPPQRVQVFAIGAERSPDVAVELRRNLRQVRQSVERHAGPGLPGPEAAASPSLLRRRLQQAHEELARIEQALGPFDDAHLNAAADTLNAARNRRALAERTAAAPGLNRRNRRRWERAAAASRAAEHHATNAWVAVAEPRRRHLTDQIHRLEEAVRSLPSQPHRARLAKLDPSLERLLRTALGEAGRHTPQWLDLGRSLPHSQQPNEAPDLGLEL